MDASGHYHATCDDEETLLFKNEEDIFKIASKLEEKDIVFSIDEIEEFYELTFYKVDKKLIDGLLIKYNIKPVDYKILSSTS